MKPKANPFVHPALLATVIASLGAVNHAQAAETQYTWNGTTNTSWATGTNWTGNSSAPTGSPTDPRLNVYNGAGQTLVYTSGDTVYKNTAGRGLVISNASGTPGSGSMEINGGSFSTFGSFSPDAVGNNKDGTLTVSGTGSFIGTDAGTILGLNSAGGTSTLTLNGGSATVAALTMGALNSIVNLNTGGTLAANSISDAGGTSTFYFNGGTLQARTATTTFMTGLDFAYVKSGGANIKTDVPITIGQALLTPVSGTSGGLTKSGAGILKLTSLANTYSGATTVSGGTLDLTTGIIYSNASWATRSITIDGGATVKVSNWGDGNAATAGGFGQTDFTASGIMVNNGTIEYVGGAASGNMDRSFTIGAGGATLVASGSDTWQITNAGRGYLLASNNGTLTLSGANNGLLGKVIPGSGGVVKSGNGTWTLSNTNTYSGATIVSNGTLKVSGSIASSDVTVNGGILASGSTGAVGKNVTVNTGAKFAAGDVETVGAATVANDLNFSSGSIFDWDLTTGAGNGTYDTVSVTGTLNITSGAKFNVVSSTAFTDTFWDATHTWSNIFGGKVIDNFLVSNFLYSGLTTAPAAEGSFSVSGSTLTWTAVPEPTSALAGLLVTAGLLRRRRW